MLMLYNQYSCKIKQVFTLAVLCPNSSVTFGPRSVSVVKKKKKKNISCYHQGVL